ncbi:MAG TPA: hypothetical protein G4N92_01685 [Anaerolineae bacterium]|nr:hypothetical protein [Anaerolineae bacterium]
MPKLIDLLRNHEPDIREGIAEAWGFSLSDPDNEQELAELSKKILHKDQFQEVFESLPDPSKKILINLVQIRHMPWIQFSRKFGQVRIMGSGQRERVRPDLHPKSPVEVLWYYGLLGRAFFDLPPEPQEFAFVPDDVQALVAPSNVMQEKALGRKATKKEASFIYPINDRILDHTCTLLAGLRSGCKFEEIKLQKPAIPPRALASLLISVNILAKNHQLNSEKTKAHLKTNRGTALASLASTWLHSKDFNELRLLRGLVFEGKWQNNPLQTRKTILGWLQHIPANTWWNIKSFISDVQVRQPDFQRPAGDYDSWFIRDESSGKYLRGFSNWEKVEGRLLRFIITGLMHWLGFIDLASHIKDRAPTAFRWSSWSQKLFQGLPPEGFAKENSKITATSDGKLRVSRLVPRVVRYQIARFCEWEGEKRKNYIYRITALSLKKAAAQGLNVKHLQSLLSRYAKQPLMPSLLQALQRWQKYSLQVSFKQGVLLCVHDKVILEKLMKSHSKRYIIEILNSRTALIKAGCMEIIQATLTELGYLSEIELQL